MPAQATAVALLLGNSTDFCFQLAQSRHISRPELAPVAFCEHCNRCTVRFDSFMAILLLTWRDGVSIGLSTCIIYGTLEIRSLHQNKRRRYVTRRRAIPPRHNRVRLQAVLDAIAGNGDVGCKWKVDVAVVRCRESILKGIASTLALARDADIPAGCLQWLCTSDACHAGAITCKTPSLRNRRQLPHAAKCPLWMRATGCLASFVSGAHALPSTPRHGDALCAAC